MLSPMSDAIVTLCCYRDTVTVYVKVVNSFFVNAYLTSDKRPWQRCNKCLLLQMNADDIVESSRTLFYRPGDKLSCKIHKM